MDSSFSGTARRCSFWRCSICGVIALAVLRFGWHGSLLLSPWSEDGDAVVRGCEAGRVALSLGGSARAAEFSSAAKITPLLEQFSYPPEVTTPGVLIEMIDSGEGCRWLYARVPRETTPAEIRRLAVALRHRPEPIVLVSELPFLFSFGNEIVARAASLKFQTIGELVRYPRVMVSYDLVGLGITEE